MALYSGCAENGFQSRDGVVGGQFQQPSDRNDRIVPAEPEQREGIYLQGDVQLVSQVPDRFGRQVLNIIRSQVRDVPAFGVLVEKRLFGIDDAVGQVVIDQVAHVKFFIQSLEQGSLGGGQGDVFHRIAAKILSLTKVGEESPSSFSFRFVLHLSLKTCYNMISERW